MIKCSDCKKLKDDAEFYSASNSKTGHTRRCKDCNRIYQSRRNYARIIKTKGVEALDALIRERQQQIALMLIVRKEAENK